MKRFVVLLPILLLSLCPLVAAQNRTYPVEDLLKVRRVGDPQVSPDGKQLAFVSDRTGNREIWLARSDGSQAHPLTAFGVLAGSEQWSPDGRMLVFDVHQSQHASIWLAAADGSPARRITRPEYEAAQPRWSHDGSSIYFTSRRNGVWQIWKISVNGGEAVQVIENGMIAYESPDGKQLYWIAQPPDMRIWTRPTEGGQPQAVPDMPPVHSAFDWVPTDRGIYFLNFNLPPQPSELRFYDFSTRRVQSLYTLPDQPLPWIGGLALSSDHRTIYFSQADNPGRELMLAENFDSM